MARTRALKPGETVVFAVEGRGDFPLDMLRYDRCWPRYEAEIYKFTRTDFSGRAPVRNINLEGLKRPTEARWESFGWRVVG